MLSGSTSATTDVTVDITNYVIMARGYASFGDTTYGRGYGQLLLRVSTNKYK